MTPEQVEKATDSVGSALYAITQALNDDSYEAEGRAGRDLGLADVYLMEAIWGSSTEGGWGSEILLHDALRELRAGRARLEEARQRLEAWERTHGI